MRRPWRLLVALVVLALALLLLRSCRWPGGVCAALPCAVREVGCIPCPTDAPILVREGESDG